MTKIERREFIKGLLFISPWLIGFLVFTVYPIFASLYMSFTEYSITGASKWVGFANYKKLFTDTLSIKAISNTLYYVAGLVPLGLIVGLVLAILLVQPLKEILFYRTTIYFPSIVPAFAFATIGVWFFNPYIGFMNNLLKLFGIQGPFWLSEQWVKRTIILMAQWGAGGTALIYMAAIKDIPKELYESAELDGATGWQRFWHITVPMISPATLYYFVIATLGALQIFDLPNIMTGGGPANSSLSFVMYLYQNAFRYGYMGYAASMAWILFVISFGLTMLIFGTTKYWVFYYGARR
jgi:multiple sugar transport system permease protein